jgi:hypothetical protein
LPFSGPEEHIPGRKAVTDLIEKANISSHTFSFSKVSNSSSSKINNSSRPFIIIQLPKTFSTSLHSHYLPPPKSKNEAKNILYFSFLPLLLLLLVFILYFLYGGVSLSLHKLMASAELS